MNQTIALDAVAAHRGGRLVLNDVSFELAGGSLTAVVGPNGAGKSSLFGVLSGRLEPTRGTVELGGAVAEVLQATEIDPRLALSVDDVVRMGRYPARGLLRKFTREDRRIIDESLELVGMREHRRRPVGELSGGQRQRVMLAQGLAQRAPILVLDEPMTGVDAPAQRELFEVMKHEAERGTTVLFATHNMGEAADADNLVVLACECICCAPPIDAFADPAVTALFGPTSTSQTGEAPMTGRAALSSEA